MATWAELRPTPRSFSSAPWSHSHSTLTQPQRLVNERAQMVKAKLLKEIRKKVDRADKVVDPLVGLSPPPVLEWTWTTHPAPRPDDDDTNDTNKGEENSDNRRAPPRAPEGESSANDNKSGATSCQRYSVEYRSSKDLPPELLQRCLELFRENMADLYRNSSFASQLPHKSDELSHPRARYLLVRATKPKQSPAAAASTTPETGSGEDEGVNSAVAYAHFRFEPDDDSSPSCAALYLYELQVTPSHARRGIGALLVRLLEQVGRHHRLDRIVLTVLRNNTAAREFYCSEKMGFAVDRNCPSQHGESADYEILSKSLL